METLLMNRSIFLDMMLPNENIMMALVSLPLITALGLMIVGFVGAHTFPVVQTQYIISCVSAGLSVFMSTLLYVSMESGVGSFQNNSSFSLFPFLGSMGFPMGLGVDGLSVGFILLTALITYLCVLSVGEDTPKVSELLSNLFLLQWALTASFLSTDMVGFFIFFEITLYPIYNLVLMYGSRERRIRASYLIALYTMVGSAALFFVCLYVYSKVGTTDYSVVSMVVFSVEEQIVLWALLFIAFAAKIPAFPLHIWLPEAHVEAPTVGSVVLAALLLKIGTYGMVRFSLALFPEGTDYLGPAVGVLAILGIIYGSMTAIRQIDLKKIIAYSSVGHMNVILLGLLAGSEEALEGAVFFMLSHGIVSAGMFFAVGVLYERYGVRSLKYYGGLAHLYPLFSTVFLAFSLANIGFPLTSGFVGEFLTLAGVFADNMWAALFASVSMVLATAYSLWAVTRIFFGNLRNDAVGYATDMSRKEVVIFGYLFVLMMAMGIVPSYVTDIIAPSIRGVISHVTLMSSF